MARRIAKTVVRAGLAREVTVAISYAIGRAEPVAFHVNTHGTGTHPDHLITQAARSMFNLRPSAMIDFLKLRRPVWADHATYGYFHERLIALWEHDRYSEAEQLRVEVNRLATQAPAHQ